VSLRIHVHETAPRKPELMDLTGYRLGWDFAMHEILNNEE